MNREEKIMARMKEHYERLEKGGYEIVGLFLQGSQNYGLDYEDSDIDTKAIILPTFEDVALGKKMFSTTLLMENDEHIDTKDVRQMLHIIKKQNINFVEILFTKFKIINPKYEAILKPLFDNRERIARMDNVGAVNCMCGMAMEKYKALEKPYPATIEKIEKFGYDPKQLHHIVRMREFFERYLDGESYEECLMTKERDFMLRVKKGTMCTTVEMARLLANTAMADIKDRKDKFYGTKRVFDEEMDKLLDEVAINLIKCRLREELEV